MADDDDEFVRRVRRAAERRARHRREGAGVWFAVGTFGLVGWSIAIPTLLGLALGVWLDARFDAEVSWTVALLLAGITLGCINAWYWVSEQQIHPPSRDGEEEQ